MYVNNLCQFFQVCVAFLILQCPLENKFSFQILNKAEEIQIFVSDILFSALRMPKKIFQRTSGGSSHSF